MSFKKKLESQFNLSRDNPGNCFLAWLLELTGNQKLVQYVIRLKKKQQKVSAKKKKKTKRWINGRVVVINGIITLWKWKIKSSSHTWKKDQRDKMIRSGSMFHVN